MKRLVRHFPIQIKKLNQRAVIPTHGSEAAAGYDLYACLDQAVTVNPHETVKIGTGIAVAIPNNCWGGIYARSGLATKEGQRPANCVGVIDPDYRANDRGIRSDQIHYRKDSAAEQRNDKPPFVLCILQCAFEVLVKNGFSSASAAYSCIIDNIFHFNFTLLSHQHTVWRSY